MFFFYQTLTLILYPILIILIFIRKLIFKESLISFKEKLFPQKNRIIRKKVIWFHGASIGEVNSIIPIINILLKNKNNFILITSTTLSSGAILRDKFSKNKNIIHKYLPLDVPFLVKNFLKNWNPDLIIFVDSEIWPNFISEIKKRNKNLILLNARITDKTLKRWLIIKNFTKKIFSCFNICIASSLESEKNLKLLGVTNIKYFGNLKYVQENKIKKKLSNQILKSLSKKKVWLAASTHRGEEMFIANTHKLIKNKINNVVTLIVPRHINRTIEIYNQLTKNSFNVQIINSDQAIRKDVDIVLINQIGILSKYYFFCKSIFMGKSLLSELILVGGQNPIEPAIMGCKIYHGPYVYNFAEVYKFLKLKKISFKINNEKNLAKRLILDLKTSKKINLKKVLEINNYGSIILKKTLNEIYKFIKK